MYGFSDFLEKVYFRAILGHFGPKSPNLGRIGFSRKIGLCHVFTFMIPKLHARDQKLATSMKCNDLEVQVMLSRKVQGKSASCRLCPRYPRFPRLPRPLPPATKGHGHGCVRATTAAVAPARFQLMFSLQFS